MERLTEKREADAQREAYERRIEQGYPRNIPEERFLKLAAYEDTGLEPDEITDFLPMLKEWRQNMGALRHVHELVTAEAKGLLVVLPPVKNGDNLFYILNEKIYEGEVYRIAYENYLGKIYTSISADRGYNVYGAHFEDFGKTVFLTREEAEAALKEREGT